MPVIPVGDPWDTGRVVCARLQERGFEAWLVGGCVRDLLLGRKVSDVDVATSASPDEVEASFEKTIAVGKSFGVCIVVIGNQQIEVASFRADGVYIDGRRPTGVVFTDAAGDVARRDYTINALLMDPRDGHILDHVGGLEDLQQRRLRVVGDPSARLQEDRLRVLRGLRFAAGLRLSWDPPSWNALVATSLDGLSGERILQEIDKGLATQQPEHWLQLLEKSGHLPEVFPVESSEPGASILAIMPPTGPDAKIAAVLGSVNAERWIDGLPFSRERQRRLRWLLEGAKVLLTTSIAERRRLLRHTDGPDLAALVGEPAREWLAAEPTHLPPLLTAKDLLAKGIPSGPQMGRLLREMEDAQLEGRLTTTAEALAWLAL